MIFINFFLISRPCNIEFGERISEIKLIKWILDVWVVNGCISVIKVVIRKKQTFQQCRKTMHSARPTVII